MTGAQYFSNNLNSNGGDLLLTIGEYNGWFKGMTYVSLWVLTLAYGFITKYVQDQATAAGDTSCCRCQNNLD